MNDRLAAVLDKGDPATKFELLEHIGKGSYGAVYKARDRDTQQVLAVKVMALDEEDEEMVDELAKEVCKRNLKEPCCSPRRVCAWGASSRAE